MSHSQAIAAVQAADALTLDHLAVIVTDTLAQVACSRTLAEARIAAGVGAQRLEEALGTAEHD